MRQADAVGDRIIANARRLLGGRSKSEVARLAGIERTKLYRFLSGRQVLRADELQRLAGTLHVNVTAFYGAPDPDPDFQSAFMKNDDFALRISGLLLGPEARYPVKAVSELRELLADVKRDPEAERIVTDLSAVLRSPALSALAFIGAWVLLWERMAVDEGSQMARAVRRIIPYHDDLLILAGSAYYRGNQTRGSAIHAYLRDVEPHEFYLKAIDHLRYVLSAGRIDQCAGLAHRVLERHRRRSQETVHRRLLAFKKTIDGPDAPRFWGRLLTFLDPNIP